MVRRTVRLAAVSLAALAAVPNVVFADLQKTGRASWTLSAERDSWSEDKAEMLRAASPAGVFGAEIGWLKISDLRPGSGLQLDLAQSWALCADWDRQRPKMMQVRETIDTFLLGVQYRFR
jgi:hypothetical protein